MNTAELRDATAAVEYPAARFYIDRKDEYQAARANWRAQITALEVQWRAWLASEYLAGTVLQAKAADVIFRKAWEEGHSEGYERVEQVYSELVDFIGEVLS